MSTIAEIRKILAELPARQLADLVSHEEPQNLAVILSLLAPEKAKDVILLLPDYLHAELLMRIGHMGPLSQDTQQSILKRVKSWSRDSEEEEAIGGKEFLSQILGKMDPENQDRSMSRIRHGDEELANAIADDVDFETRRAQLRAMWYPKPANDIEERLERIKETQTRINGFISELSSMSKQSSSDPEKKN